MTLRRWTRRLAALATMALLTLAVPPDVDARSDRPPSKADLAAVEAWLRAEPEEEAKALKKATRHFGRKIDRAVAAVRLLPPLRKAKAGTEHGLPFESGGHTWTYSIRLPAGYDGTTRHPVLLLPDHGSVGPEAGIGFWDGKAGAEPYILFRPEIVKHQGDTTRFPDTQFFARDQAIALVYADALRHLRLHYAADPERISATGLSQAGYYTWYLGVSFPDQFAALVPESAGGMAIRAAVGHVVQNLAQTPVRILHTDGDQITPYADAVRLKDKLEALDAPVELITYTDGDYPGAPFPKRHPGPHHLRLQHVLPWAHTHARQIPTTFTRALRYGQHGHEGRWRLTAPAKVGAPEVVTCTDDDGTLSCTQAGAVYLVSPEDLEAKRVFRVGSKKVKPKGDVEVLLRAFKRDGDRGRLVVAEIELP